jgi:hypothetical protein
MAKAKAEIFSLRMVNDIGTKVLSPVADHGDEIDGMRTLSR